MAKEDVVLTPAGSVGEVRQAGKPIYLVIVEEGLKTKSLAYYLCQKLDKQESYVEFRGILFTGNTALLETTDPQTLFDPTKSQELTFPWQRVVQIKNLSFKATK